MSGWLKNLQCVLDSGEPAEIVTVIGVRGSAPREVGARMLISRQETFGTIGGGQLEYQCIRRATQRLAAGERAALVRRRFPLGADCGQCCGGVVEVLFEDLTAASSRYTALLERCATGPAVLVTECTRDEELRRSLGAPNEMPVSLSHGAASRIDRPGGFTLYEPFGARRFDVAVFGAGHVGSAVVALLSTLDAEVRWIDNRANVFPPETPDGVQARVSPEPWREIDALLPGSYVLVMTHSHPLDYDICAAALRRKDLIWIGLIGSRAKRRRFAKRFGADGIEDRDLVCPIGIDGIKGKRPAEIALAVAAQLVRHREQQTARGSDAGSLRIMSGEGS